MNRRSFFSRLLGAACLAVAERVLPSSLSGVAAQWAEPEQVVIPEGCYHVVSIGLTTFVMTTDGEWAELTEA